MTRGMRDFDKLMTIAQTYSYIKGSFTAKELYEFIRQNNYKFHSDYTSKQIGLNLSKSIKFKKIEEKPAKYEAI